MSIIMNSQTNKNSQITIPQFYIEMKVYVWSMIINSEPPTMSCILVNDCVMQ